MVSKNTKSNTMEDPEAPAQGLPPGFSARREPGGKTRLAYGPSKKTIVVATEALDDVTRALEAFMPVDESQAVTPPPPRPEPKAEKQPEPEAAAPVPPPKVRAKASSTIQPLALGPDGRPENWHAKIAGSGYEMRYRIDPENNQPGYEIVANDKEIASVRYEGTSKLVLRHTSGAKITIHRNIEGVRSRLDALYRS